MLTRKFIIPTVSSSTDISTEAIENLTNTQINNDTWDVDNLLEILDSLYAALYTKTISYDKIHSYLILIFEYLIAEENGSKNDLFIKFLFEAELLVQNFYYSLRQRIVSEDLHTIFGIQFIDVEYPIFKVEKNIDLFLMIDKLFQNKYKPDEKTSDLIFGFLLLQKNSDMREFFASNSESRMILNFIFSYKKSLLFKEFFLAKNADFDLGRFYLGNIDKNKMVEKCFLNNITHVQRQIITQSKSHYYIDHYFQHIINNSAFESLFVTTSELDDPHTFSVLHKLLDHNRNYGEQILKKLILRNKEARYKNLFFHKCRNVDPEFIEICILYMDGVNSLGHSLFKSIVTSKYFNFFSRDISIFKNSITRLSESNFDPESIRCILNSIFADIKYGDEKVYYKLSCFLASFPGYKQEISTQFIRLFFETYNTPLCTCRKRASDASELNQVTKMSDMSSPNFNQYTTVFQLIDCLRDQKIIQDNLDKFIEIDFSGFVEYCYNADNFCMDMMLYKTFKYLQQNKISSKEFLRNYLNHLNKIKHEKYYWDIILKKNTNQMEIYKSHTYRNLDKRTLINHFYDFKMLIRTITECLETKPIDYEVLKDILYRLEQDSKYKNGLALNNSEISFATTGSTSFCLYAIFHQYDIKDKQKLVTLKGSDFLFELSLSDGNLLKPIEKNGASETFLVKSDKKLDNVIFLGLKLSKEKLTFYYNHTKYHAEIPSCKKITLGKGFKGVLSRLIFYEGSRFDQTLFDKYNDSSLYYKKIQKLEKRLAFQNDAGFCIHNGNPYYFTQNIKIELKGVIVNKNILWIENHELRKLFYDKMHKDKKLLEIFDNFISSEVSKLIR